MMYALAVVGLLIGADDAKKNDPLTGTWVVISRTQDGNDIARSKDSTITFADGKVTIKTKDGTQEGAGTYTCDTSKKPAEIDVVPTNEPAMKGIFIVTKDELKVCLSKADRPKEFSSNAGEMTMLVVLKKQSSN